MRLRLAHENLGEFMSRWGKFRTLGLALALLLPVFTMSGGAGASKAASGKPIQIGLVVSTTGLGAVYGVDQRAGADLAAKMINAAGGINGHPIKIDFENDNYTPATTQSAYAQILANNSVIGIIGPTSSSSALSADPLAVAAKVPVLAISNGAIGIPQIGTYVHRVGVPEPELQPIVARDVIRHFKITSAAIIYASDNPFGVTGYNAYSQALKSEGATITNVQSYLSASTVDFTPQLQTIASGHPQLLFVAAVSNEGATIVQEANQLGMKVVMVGNLAFTSSALIKIAGSAANGLLTGATWTSKDPGKLNQVFVSKYQAAYGRPASPIAATAFNAVYIVKQALSHSSSYTRASLQKGLNAMKAYHFVGEPVNFVSVGGGFRDAKTAEPDILQAENGSLVPFCSGVSCSK